MRRDEPTPETESARDGSPEQQQGSPEEDEEAHALGRSEELADRAIDRFREEARFPDVAETVGRMASFLRAVHRRFLGFTLALHVVAAGIGLFAVLRAGLADWYMHAAMYGVLLSFLVIYAKADLMGRRFARGIYAVLTTGLLLYFAWVLGDLAPAQTVVRAGEAVERAPLPLLRATAVVLASTAGAVVMHWVVLTRYQRDG